MRRLLTAILFLIISPAAVCGLPAALWPQKGFDIYSAIRSIHREAVIISARDVDKRAMLEEAHISSPGLIVDDFNNDGVEDFAFICRSTKNEHYAYYSSQAGELETVGVKAWLGVFLSAPRNRYRLHVILAFHETTGVKLPVLFYLKKATGHWYGTDRRTGSRVLRHVFGTPGVFLCWVGSPVVRGVYWDRKEMDIKTLYDIQ